MHIGKCVPMIALCLLLCGCKEQAEETDIRAAYREMSGCELTMKVVCGEAQREWAATLQCHYAPEGESTVEVTEPRWSWPGSGQFFGRRTGRWNTAICA